MSVTPAQTPPYFSGQQYNGAFFRNANTTSITLAYANSTYLKRIGVATSVASLTTFTQSVSIATLTTSTAFNCLTGLIGNNLSNTNLIFGNYNGSPPPITTVALDNVFIGNLSAALLVLGKQNVSIGSLAMQLADVTSSVNFNVAIGYKSQWECANFGNTSVGCLSLWQCSGGQRNTSVGYKSGQDIVGSGSNNLTCGYLSGSDALVSIGSSNNISVFGNILTVSCYIGALTNVYFNATNISFASATSLTSGTALANIFAANISSTNLLSSTTGTITFGSATATHVIQGTTVTFPNATTFGAGVATPYSSGTTGQIFLGNSNANSGNLVGQLIFVSGTLVMSASNQGNFYTPIGIGNLSNTAGGTVIIGNVSGGALSLNSPTVNITNATSITCSASLANFCNAATSITAFSGATTAALFTAALSSITIGSNTSSLTFAGSKINITAGANKSVDTATLTSGTVTVSNSTVTANSKIFLQRTAINGSAVLGELQVTSVSAGTNFIVTALSVTTGLVLAGDASSFNYYIIN